MANKLEGKRVALVATDKFENDELLKPKQALEEEGAMVDIISLKSGEIKGVVQDDEEGDIVDVTKTIDEANPDDYDALLLPGGVGNPDKLRVNEDVIKFVKSFIEADKPIAAICHGPWTLINAEGVEFKKMTSWPSLQKDLENAGASWVDEEVVVDGNLVTSRKPDDIPAFNREFIALISA